MSGRTPSLQVEAGIITEERTQERREETKKDLPADHLPLYTLARTTLGVYSPHT
jgi:hypothetical protein